MEHVWISSGSTTIEAMVNPIAAACVGDGITEPYVPDTVYFLDNPGLDDAIDTASELTQTILRQHGVDEPTIEVATVEHETEFDAIVGHYQTAIEAAQEDGADVAVDVTPGRKFMSVIAFNAGTTFDVDHIFYFYLKSSEYYSRIYPNIPKPAAELYDFTEVLA
ncbi:hypothetical protein [Halonotius sp. GCM10025705]|uniref:hypothetical protein n=1 Tax=Halonotius sp. GCM10025705 TaxID=3252678 RepID=UPI003623EE97